MCDVTDCVCGTAVPNTYRNLRARDVPHDKAFAAAARVYRYHHPESTAFEILSAVSRMIRETAEHTTSH